MLNQKKLLCGAGRRKGQHRKILAHDGAIKINNSKGNHPNVDRKGNRRHKALPTEHGYNRQAGGTRQAALGMRS